MENKRKILTVREQESEVENVEGSNRLIVFLIVCVVFFVAVLLFLLTDDAHADVVDLKKIAKIESSNCKYKNGDSGSSIGCYQVKDALVEWNQFHPREQYSKRQMMNDAICLKVADWYINKRIPQMLRHFRKPVTIRNQIISYNAGISYVVKNKTLPKITVNYLRKYGA